MAPPATYTPEQLAQIVTVACEVPATSAHGTPRALTDEVMTRGIVPTISSPSVGRFFKRLQAKTSSVAVLAQS